VADIGEMERVTRGDVFFSPSRRRSECVEVRKEADDLAERIGVEVGSGGKDAPRSATSVPRPSKGVHLNPHQRGVSTADDCRRSRTVMNQAGALLLLAALASVVGVLCTMSATRRR
jgi:hypothetical protein